MNIKLFEGIYGATSGPTYETPSEVRAFVKLGASCFGMSTIPGIIYLYTKKIINFFRNNECTCSWNRSICNFFYY